MSTPPGTVHVRRSAGPGSDWLALTAHGSARRGRLDQICKPAEAVVLLAPGPDVRLLSVQLPGIKAGQAAAAIPFALEDRLAEDVETLAVAAGRASAPGSYPVAVVARRRLAGWVAAVTQTGARLLAVIPECACLPWSPGDLSVLLDGRMVHVRYGADRAISVEASLLPAVLSGLPGDPVCTRVRLFAGAELDPGLEPDADSDSDSGPDSDPDSGPESGARSRSELRAALAAIAPVTEESPSSVLRLLADGVAGAMAFDLIRAGRRTGRGGGSVLRSWRLPAAVLVLLALLSGAGVMLESASLERQLRAWDVRTQTLYREAFPEARRVDDVQRLIQQRLAARAAAPEGDAAGRFLALLGVAAPPLAASERLALTAIAYRPGRLELDLSAPELADFESFRKTLAGLDPALRAELASAVATPEGATARVRLSAQ